MLAFVGLVCSRFFPDAFRPAGRNFAPYRKQLLVSRTSLERGQRKPDFWLGGYITNTGDYPWRVQALEVRFMEGEERLVDVRHAKIPETFVVQPHQEQAFRVELGRLVFTNIGIVAKVRVQTAIDGILPAKTD
jgi:hypothetical protein